jgi:glucose-1-phosphate adenylyltransferase
MPKKQVMGLLFPNMGDEMLGEMTTLRAMGSAPFGGRYRLIDFALSNMVNAGISKVGVITKKNYNSLMDHLGSGKAWDLSRKQQGLYYLPPLGTDAQYEGRISSLSDIMPFLNASKQEVVVLSDCYAVGNIDLEKMIDAHLESGADVTLGYVNGCLQGALDRLMVTVDGQNRVTEIVFNQSAEQVEGNYGIGLYVMQKSYLMQMVKDAVGRNQMHFERDILQKHIDTINVLGYEIKEKTMLIHSPARYFSANMELLKPEVRGAVFQHGKPIFTKVRDCSPAIYGLKSQVSNSLIGDGATVNGTVKNSVIFRDVDIAAGAVVENCVIMQGATIGENTVLKNMIIDKNVVIKSGRTLQGFDTYPVYVGKNTIV